MTTHNILRVQDVKVLLKLRKQKMKPHNEFMKEVEEASSLPAQTKKALGPESEEDFDVYGGQSE